MGGLQPDLELHQRAAADRNPDQSAAGSLGGVGLQRVVLGVRIGIWLSARGSRSLRVVGALMMLPAASIPLWLLFGDANLAAHLALAVMGILSWLGTMGFGAAALGKRFRIYSHVSLAVVVAFNALALSYAPEVNAGQPTPFIGLDERIAFATYFLWQSVLAVALLRRRPNGAGKGAVAPAA
jgi:hypothetical protein